MSDSAYNIFYVSLSTLPRGFSDKVKIVGHLQSVEQDPQLEELYDAIERGADKTNPRSVLLNKYRLTVPVNVALGDFGRDIHSIGLGDNDVYGIQTNEATIKSLLQRGVVIDNMILIASDMVYQGSRLQLSGNHDAVSLKGMLDEKKRDFSAVEISGDALNEMKLAESDQETADSVNNGEKEFYRWTNTLDYFLMEIRFYCCNVLGKKMSDCIKKITIYPMDNDPDRGKMTNCAIDVATEILQAKEKLTRKDRIKKEDAETTSEEPVIHLYIDSNGGKRDLIIIQIAILRALRVHGIEPEVVMYSNYTPGRKQQAAIHEKGTGEDGELRSNDKDDERNNKWGNHPVEIVDKKREYEIFDVVSGTDEFVSYGRVGKLQRYFANSSSGIEPVLNSIDAMCKAFMTCFTNEMVDSVVEVKRQIGVFERNQSKTQAAGKGQGESSAERAMQYKLADYVVGQIRNDLGAVLDAVGSGSDDEAGKARVILPLIEWCRDKKYYQQALTLYVDRIDAWYYVRKILKGPDNRTDFYKFYMGRDCKKEKYDTKIREIFDGIASKMPYPFSKHRFLDILKEAGEEGDLHCIRSKLNSIMHDVSNCYDSKGNKKQGSAATLPGNIEKFAKKIVRELMDSPGHFISGNLSRDVQGELARKLADRISIRFPKDKFLDELRAMDCDEYDIDTLRFRGLIDQLDGMYDDNGVKTGSFGDYKINASNMYALMSDSAFTSSYKKVSDQYVNCYSLREQLDDESLLLEQDTGEKAKPTYVEKQIHIEHYTEDLAEEGVLLRGKRNEKLGMLRAISQYYLAFKIIRNNSNHSNGKGDIYAKVACDWLGSEAGGNVLNLSTCVEDENTIAFKYETTEDLLEKAICFNKTLINGSRHENCGGK